MSTKKKVPAHSQGSGNIFADLACPMPRSISSKLSSLSS
jgi:hypothetical protein